ncbi:MAG: transglutaminase-like domain-containing protein [Melioribacteraceae bacterium]|nr:transglutaminase-like domain-containing protein [Melioribacteraceae bacterium]
MLTKESLPHIISLVDDNSEEVRNQVFKDLSGYGTDLETDLVEFSDILNRKNLHQIKPIIEKNRRDWLLANWKNWYTAITELDKIEIAMNLISKFQLGVLQQTPLSTKLDIIAGNFVNLYPYGNELDLSNYLFHVLDLKGNTDDYYHPLNCNLYHTFESGMALPITLVLIYILIADRVGLQVVGCNFPGHFLAKIEIEGEMLMIDCFNSGRIIFESDLENLSTDSYEALLTIINTPLTARTVIKRVITNLINAYREKGDSVNQQFLKELLLSSPLR